MIQAIEADSFLFECSLGSVRSSPRKRRIRDGKTKITAHCVARNHLHPVRNGFGIF